MGWFGFDDYDIDTISAGISVPLDPVPEFELFGYANFNDGHPTDVFDALEAETVKQNTRALHYALKAEELTGDTPASGHTHNEEKTIIDYIPLLKMGGSNGLSGVGAFNAQAVVDVTTFKKWGWGVVVFPSGHIVRPVIYPKARASLNTHQNILDVKLSFYEGVSGVLTNIDTTPVYTQVFRLDATASGQDRVWFEGRPIQLVGLSTFPAISGKRLLYLKVETRVTTGQGVLHEVELSWSYGL